MHVGKQTLWITFAAIPAMLAMACSEVTATSANPALTPHASAYPRLTAPAGEILQGADARAANWASARQRAAHGDSTLLLALTSYDDRMRAFALAQSHQPTASFDGETSLTLQEARIYDSGTDPDAVGAAINEYLDYEGDQQLSRGQYKITDPQGLLGDWADLADNDNPGDMHYTDLDACGRQAACMWHHQEQRYSVSMPSCGKDLWGQGNHSAWYSGTSISVFGVFTVQIIDPSAKQFTTDVAKSSAGTSCDVNPPDTYSQGGGGEINNDCPLEDQYMWFHYGEYMGDVCIQNGQITYIG